MFCRVLKNTVFTIWLTFCVRKDYTFRSKTWLQVICIVSDPKKAESKLNRSHFLLSLNSQVDLVCCQSVIEPNMNIKQNVQIFKLFTVFILAVISLWSSRQECSFLSLLAVVENPLQVQLHCPQMNYSSRMWSIKCSGLHTCLRTCLMIQNHNKLVFQQIIVSTPPPWSDKSCPIHTIHTQHRKVLSESMHPKMWRVRWLIKWHGLNSSLCIAS